MRYRHTDTDLVRAARQQDFLSAARQRVPIDDLVLGRNELIDIFTEYTTSDISDTETMIDVLKLFIASRNASINEVHFPAELGPSYVYATPGSDRRRGRTSSSGSKRAAARAARSKASSGKKKRRRARRSSKEARTSRRPSRRAATGWCPPRKPARPRRSRRPQGRRRLPGLLPDAAALRRRLRRKPTPTCHIQDPRVYHFKDTDGNRHGAYRMVDRPSNSPTESITSGCRGSRAGRTRRSSTTRAKRGRSTAANTRSSSTATGSS